MNIDIGIVTLERRGEVERGQPDDLAGGAGQAEGLPPPAGRAHQALRQAGQRPARQTTLL